MELSPEPFFQLKEAMPSSLLASGHSPCLPLLTKRPFFFLFVLSLAFHFGIFPSPSFTFFSVLFLLLSIAHSDHVTRYPPLLPSIFAARRSDPALSPPFPTCFVVSLAFSYLSLCLSHLPLPLLPFSLLFSPIPFFILYSISIYRNIPYKGIL